MTMIKEKYVCTNEFEYYGVLFIKGRTYDVVFGAYNGPHTGNFPGDIRIYYGDMYKLVSDKTLKICFTPLYKIREDKIDKVLDAK